MCHMDSFEANSGIIHALELNGINAVLHQLILLKLACVQFYCCTQGGNPNVKAAMAKKNLPQTSSCDLTLNFGIILEYSVVSSPYYAILWFLNSPPITFS